MTKTTNGTFLANVCGRRSIDASRAAKRSLRRGRTTLGALAFRALARALAWLVFLGRADRSVGRAMGLVCGPDLGARVSRAAAEVLPGRVRRVDPESTAERLLLRAAPSRAPRRSLPLRRFDVSRSDFMRRLSG
jgi:hypothetical protein